MDGVLLVAAQSSQQSWQYVSQQFAPRLGLSVQRLDEALRESRRAYRKEIAHDVQKQRRDRLKPFETRQETVAHALENIGRSDSALAVEMVHAYEATHEKRKLAPGTLDTLQKLRDCALPLALISNGNATYQRKKIAQYHLAPFFETILIEEEFGVAKPDQRIFRAALDHLCIPAQAAWMIGDNLAFDIAGSQQLGVFAIWCDLAQHGLPVNNTIQPDQIIHALPELLNLLRNAEASHS
jgi:haloacid dehalogenase superfamily, subfamily IA, variant 1 with third motif having Dx(3-4)D or Dx(3-4)E